MGILYDFIKTQTTAELEKVSSPVTKAFLPYGMQLCTINSILERYNDKTELSNMLAIKGVTQLGVPFELQLGIKTRDFNTKEIKINPDVYDLIKGLIIIAGLKITDEASWKTVNKTAVYYGTEGEYAVYSNLLKALANKSLYLPIIREMKAPSGNKGWFAGHRIDPKHLMTDTKLYPHEQVLFRKAEAQDTVYTPTFFNPMGKEVPVDLEARFNELDTKFANFWKESDRKACMNDPACAEKFLGIANSDTNIL